MEERKFKCSCEEPHYFKRKNSLKMHIKRIDTKKKLSKLTNSRMIVPHKYADLLDMHPIFDLSGYLIKIAHQVVGPEYYPYHYGIVCFTIDDSVAKPIRTVLFSIDKITIPDTGSLYIKRAAYSEWDGELSIKTHTWAITDGNVVIRVGLRKPPIHIFTTYLGYPIKCEIPKDRLDAMAYNEDEKKRDELALMDYNAEILAEDYDEETFCMLGKLSEEDVADLNFLADKKYKPKKHKKEKKPIIYDQEDEYDSSRSVEDYLMPLTDRQTSIVNNKMPLIDLGETEFSDGERVERDKDFRSEVSIAELYGGDYAEKLKHFSLS